MDATTDVTVLSEHDAADTVPVTPLWRNRSVNLLLGSQTLSDLGTNMATLAVPLIVLAQTGSAVTAGFVGTAAGVARIVVRLPFGVVADRVNRKKAMITCDAIRIAVFLAAGVALLAGDAPLALLVAMVMIDAGGGRLFAACGAGALPNFLPAPPNA